MFLVRRNNAGFSMMELLAAVVVLGILMGIAIPAVMNVMQDQRHKTYVDDAVRLSSNMEYKMNSDNMVPVPAVGSCIAMNLAYLDNNTFNDAPNDGEYDRLGSFVVAKRVSATADVEYVYYVRLLEKMKGGNYRGIDLRAVDDDGTGVYLYMEKAYDKCISNVGSSSRNDFVLTNYISNTSPIISRLNSYGISCNKLIIYAPDDTTDEE